MDWKEQRAIRHKAKLVNEYHVRKRSQVQLLNCIEADVLMDYLRSDSPWAMWVTDAWRAFMGRYEETLPQDSVRFDYKIHSSVPHGYYVVYDIEVIPVSESAKRLCEAVEEWQLEYELTR